MKTIKTAKYIESQRYKSDEDIESEFSNMTIQEIQLKPGLSSGWIQLDFPEGGEHVGGGANEVTDHWIKYEHNGKIAFDNWYPTNIYNQLVLAIEQKIQKTKQEIKNTPIDPEKQKIEQERQRRRQEIKNEPY